MNRGICGNGAKYLLTLTLLIALTGMLHGRDKKSTMALAYIITQKIGEDTFNALESALQEGFADPRRFTLVPQDANYRRAFQAYLRDSEELDKEQLQMFGIALGVDYVGGVDVKKINSKYRIYYKLYDIGADKQVFAKSRTTTKGEGALPVLLAQVMADITWMGKMPVSLDGENGAPETRHPAEPEMALIEGGTFAMGCASLQGVSCNGDEYPVHDVTLNDFYIAKYEVTQAQWNSVMGAGSNFSVWSGVDNPVDNVSWEDAQEFIARLNEITGKRYRLPTEAEWEYAARGGKLSRKYRYSGSNNIDKVAWHEENSDFQSHPVGQKAPNELGIYDMSGNVWEWCSDWSDVYSEMSAANPMGGESGARRAARGGGWFNAAGECRNTARGKYAPDKRENDLGFRLAMSVSKKMRKVARKIRDEQPQ